MSHWASGVTVVTCTGERGTHGMTASSFTSLSLEPPLILICVKHDALTHELLPARGAFGVHILAEGMEELSNRCAGFLGTDAHWLADVPQRVEATGAPILEGVLAWLDCRLCQAYPGGDHTIYIGEIQAAGAAEGAPLLWHQRGYRRLAP
jgi:flavin reductase (DIM6/NTAB) family NADH-FMN oxidoreductase RutF